MHIKKNHKFYLFTTSILVISILIFTIPVTFAVDKPFGMTEGELNRPTFNHQVSFPTPNPKPVPLNEQVSEIAKSYIGVPYLWGGVTPSGFDCSGLVQYVYNQIGVDLERTTTYQIGQGRAVPIEDLQQGDLVFFGNPTHHVGIYIGNNCFVHAPYEGQNVRIDSLSDRSDYNQARRIIE